MRNEYEVVVSDENADIVNGSGSMELLAGIRPAWRVKNLISRVERLLPIDPSSACQRIFNASLHDLREKIVIAGIDIAKEAADNNKLPQIKTEEDVLHRYNVSKVIELSYHMGLLTRPEWRRLTRVYEIRKDLEHEDDEYEAGIEDCVYIFKTCIDVVLSKDPVQLLKLVEIKDIVEEPIPITIEQSVIADYEHAPKKRQEEIYDFLISTSLNTEHPDIVRQNSFMALGVLRNYTHKDAILNCSNKFIDRIGRNTADLKYMRVAYCAGILPYLKITQRKDFFNKFYNNIKAIGYHWSEHASHGDLLRDFKEVGSLKHCPEPERSQILEWMVLCYIGEPGAYGEYGYNRKVFYSNTGASMIEDILSNSKDHISQDEILKTKENRRIKSGCIDIDISKRFDELISILS